MSLEELYKEVILDHYAHPRNQGQVEHPTAEVHLHNPSCGDDIYLDVAIKDGTITEARFRGAGCSISQASASMMTESVQGMTIDRARRLITSFHAMMRGEGTVQDGSPDLVALAGVAKFPVRVKCALLAWDALQKALDQAGAGGENPHDAKAV